MSSSVATLGYFPKIVGKNSAGQKTLIEWKK